MHSDIKSSDISTLNDIRRLPKAERIFLEYYSLIQGCSPQYFMDSVRRYANLRHGDCRYILRELNRKGTGISHDYYAWMSYVEPRIRLLTIINMVQNFPQDENFFRDLFLSARLNLNMCVDLIDSIKFALGDTPHATLKPINDSQYSLLIAAANEPLFARLRMCYSEKEQIKCLWQIVTTHLYFDIPMTTQKLDNICMLNMADKKSLYDMPSVIDAIRRLYLYFLKGEFTPKNLGSYRLTLWDQLLYAIIAANHGQYEEALKLFSQVLKEYNKTTEIKNVLPDFLTSYYLILTYAHVGNKTSQTKLQQFRNKKDLESDYQQQVSRSLAYAFSSEGHKPDIYALKRACSPGSSDTPPRGVSLLAVTAARYFDVEVSDEISKLLLDDPSSLPRHLILRHEASAYLPLSDEERAQLAQLYDTKPMLTSIYRKSDWEWAIDEVLGYVEQTVASAAEAKTQKKERLIYMVADSRDEVMPMQQTWLKSDRWSVPKSISCKKFETLDAPYLEDCDRKMIDLVHQLNAGRFYVVWPSIQAASTVLTDCDRVYMYEDLECTNPVKFEVENFHLKFTPMANGGISVDSNIPANMLELGQNTDYVKKVKKGVYHTIHVSPQQREIAKRLISINTFPAHSQEQVKQMLTRLEDVVEVRSPLLSSKSIPNFDGATKLVARISPAGIVGYTVDFMIRLHPQGQAYTYPGEGRNVVYDMVDGKNVRIKRNIKGEIASFQNLSDELEFLSNDNSDNGGFTYTLDVEQLLELIEYAQGEPDSIDTEWREGKPIKVATPTPSSWNMGLKSTNEWFEVEGEVHIDEHTSLSMAHLLELMSQSQGRYVRLNDTDYLRIGTKLRNQLKRIEALVVKNRGKMVISPFSAALLDDKALTGEISVDYDDKLVEIKKRISESFDYTPKVPSTLNAQLRPYQIEGFQWMTRLASWGAGACLADDMGLGKTVQTIAFLLHKASQGAALVAAPASVVPNWMAELERFAPTLRPTVLNRAADRRAAIEEAGPYDVILTTYGILNTEGEALKTKKWTTICLDEAHIIKNKETKMSQAVMELSGECRIILTGTPIQNHLGELWNLFRFINPGMLGSPETFRHKFVLPIQENDKERQRALQRIIKPFMLRRTKSEVVEDLPDKTEIVMPVELSDGELALYEAMRIKAANAISEAARVDVNTLAEITRLRRAACSMELVNDSWTGESSKIQAFLELAEEFSTGTNRMLVFSQFTSFLSLVRKALEKAGIKYLYLDGSTTMKERERLVAEFRSGSVPLFLISLKAGGLGLNLPEANYVAHLDPWWNPAIEQQATDRAYRIGQKRNVTVYHFVAKNTIEEKIRRLHRTKRDLADSLLEGTDMASKLGISDILELVNS